MNKLVTLSCMMMSLTLCAQNDLMERYEDYKVKEITNRRFKHKDVMDRLEGLRPLFKVKTVGRSVEGREIKLVSLGKGPIDVLMWSQMHGNEPTATMALLDMFSFLEQADEFDPLREQLSQSLTMHFIPMLNPDGAERFQRRNMQGIDINRDALRLQTPEGRALKKVRDSLDADWGFNLHDQSRYTKVGNQPATISFLAPAYDYERTVNQKRGDAMKLIVAMNKEAQTLIPDQVGRYWDDFEPRAFGDNIQRWGTRTILVESGGQRNDREKQFIRQVNFKLLMTALEQISTGMYQVNELEEYDQIPNNDNGRLVDLVLMNLKWEGYTTDVAFRQIEVENVTNSSYYLKGSIADLGDLSTASSYEVFDASDFTSSPGRILRLNSIEDLADFKVGSLLQSGITDVIFQEPFNRWAVDLPFRLHVGNEAKMDDQLKLGSNTSLLLSKDEKVYFAIINGQLINVNE
jgi:hypothetical protein